jgi:hypothetical protein
VPEAPSPPSRFARLFVPSAASIAVHAILLIGVLAATITVSTRDADRPRLTDIAPANAATQFPQPPAPETSTLPASPASLPVDMPAEPLRSREFAKPSAAPTAEPLPQAARSLLDAPMAPPQRSVSLAGLASSAAERVVYVVDASGGMVSSFAFIRAKLAHSIAGLSPTQQFQILMARQPTRGPAVEFFRENQRDDLVRALPEARSSAIEWIQSRIVGGRSDPLEGLRAALALNPSPDLIFFLSRGFIRTGENAWSVETVLAELDRLNPRNPRTGYRPIVIKTLQFLDDDPTGLMQAIASEHGDGEGSFRILTVDDLANEGADDNAIATERDVVAESALRESRAMLMAVEREVLHVLYGLPTPDERKRVLDAARAAEHRLGPRIGELRTHDAALRARAALLAAAATGERQHAKHAVRLLDDLFLIDADADAARRIALVVAHALAGEIDAAQTLAAALESDINVLALPDHLASELAIACARFGLASALVPSPAWRELALEANAARLAPSIGADAYEPMLTAARTQPQRQADLRARVVSAMESIAHEDLPPEALFARAMILAPDRPGDAVDLLLMLAERNPAHARAPDAFWEASVLLQDLDRARAADVLERLVQACPHDDRVASALRSAIAWTPADAAPARLRRLMLAIDRAPDDPHIDAWRVQAAVLSPPSAAWPLLEAVPLGSDWALPAAQHAVEIVAEETSPEPLARALALAERASHAAAASLRARLVFARLAIIDPSAEHVQQTLELASRLDATRPDQRLLLAKSLLAAGKRREALEHLDALTTLEPQRTDHWWESWTLLLEVALDGATPVDAAAAHAHLFRLSLIDPELGGSPWQERLQALRAVAPGYTGKP